MSAIRKNINTDVDSCRQPDIQEDTWKSLDMLHNCNYEGPDDLTGTYAIYMSKDPS